MSNLFSALGTASNALRAFDRALEATQNNINNAATPGFAKQRSRLEALPFEPANGLPGGVRAGALVSARDQYAEQAVRRQVELLGNFTQQAGALASIAGVFDVSGKSGIFAALNQFFQSVSAWSVTPNSPAARQEVLNSAGAVATSFQQASQQLSRISAQLDGKIGQTAVQINALTAQLAQFNQERARAATPDPGLDARIHASLENLSELVNFTTLYAADGTVTVLLGGQTPLVQGDRQFAVSTGFFQPAAPPPVNPGAPPAAHLLDSNGQDITSQVSQGQLAGLLSVRNGLLPGLLGDGQQQGDLNRLAQQFADRVNQILGQGQITQGPPPQSGVPLFAYTGGSPTGVAATLALAPGITPSLLAAIDPGPPLGANGTALRLAGLANSTNPADQINGLTYTGYYSSLSARVGQQLADAKQGEQTQSLAVAQARSLRGEISGVSLDEEATRLIELQRSYQANARMVTVVSELTETVINMLR